MGSEPASSGHAAEVGAGLVSARNGLAAQPGRGRRAAAHRPGSCTEMHMQAWTPPGVQAEERRGRPGELDGVESASVTSQRAFTNCPGVAVVNMDTG